METQTKPTEIKAPKAGKSDADAANEAIMVNAKAKIMAILATLQTTAQDLRNLKGPEEIAFFAELAANVGTESGAFMSSHWAAFLLWADNKEKSFGRRQELAIRCNDIVDSRQIEKKPFKTTAKGGAKSVASIAVRLPQGVDIKIA